MIGTIFSLHSRLSKNVLVFIWLVYAILIDSIRVLSHKNKTNKLVISTLVIVLEAKVEAVVYVVMEII